MLILPSMYQSTMRGTSRRPFGATERRALPHPAGDELERAGADLGARRRDPDDRRNPPAAMAAFERLAHRRDIADALKAVIGAALGQVDEVGHQIAGDFLRVGRSGSGRISRRGRAGAG